MVYLKAGQILLIHSIVIDVVGGLHGVRDHGAVAGIAALPRQKVFGRELYPGVFLKAAVYARSIMLNHVFVDGNKRTGMSATTIFLEKNGYVVNAQKDEIADFAVRIVERKLECEKIADWFKAHSRKTKQKKKSIHKRKA